MALQKLLGVENLVRKADGGKLEEFPVSTLEGKVTLLYFSASWCGPCRQFTPELAKFYRKMKASDKRDTFEIIWIASDNSERDFDAYYKEMPWPALAFKEREVKKKLSKKVRVQSIPTLAVFDKDAKLIHSKARDYVLKDTEGKDFPWIPKKVTEILSKVPIKSHDTEKPMVSFTEIKQNDFALYFAAHYVPPCRAFTPRLATIYEKMRKNGKKMEIIYCPFDREESHYAEAWEEMPWLSLPQHHEALMELKDSLQLETLPTLVTVKPDGTVINKNAKSQAEEDPEGANFPWAGSQLPAFCSMNPSEAVVEALNEEICAILYLNGSTNKTTFRHEFEDAAKKYNADENSKIEGEGNGKVRFFIIDEKEETPMALYKNLANSLGIQPPKNGETTVLLTNIANDGAHQIIPGSIQSANIIDRVKEFKKIQDEADTV